MRYPTFNDQPTIAAASPRISAAKLVLALPLLAGALMLGACGSDANMADRAGGGAAVGAGTGAAIGAIFGGIGALPGALIGAAVGGGTGVATTDEQVDLGEPVWRKDW